MERLKAEARDIFEQALRAADPETAVLRVLEDLRAQGRFHPHRLHIAGLGKAARAMFRGAQAFCRSQNLAVEAALLTTTPAAGPDPEGAELIQAGHPFPTAKSLEAGRKLFRFCQSLGPEDALLLLVSGGGSALAVLPAEGISFDAKLALSKKLILSGASIAQINAVRCALSRLKGGGLARAAHPAQVIALILSDIENGEVEAVASGPSVPSPPAHDAEETLRQFGLWADLPASLRQAIEAASSDAGTRTEPPLRVQNLSVGGSSLAVEGAALAAARQGRCARLDHWISGDVQHAAERLLEEMRKASEAAGGGPARLVAGGETTVRVTGTGEGGRNQELALRFALAEAQRPLRQPWGFMSVGTDGIDGPTDAAGAFVSHQTLANARAAGLDLEAVLRNNDSHPALQRLDALIKTGPTGGNVADLFVGLVGC